MPAPASLRLRRAARWLRRRVAGVGPDRLKQVRYRGATFELLVNEDVGWRIVHAHDFEGAELDALLPFVRPDDLCVDVGAHVGVYSVLLAQRAVKGRVLAVEPLDDSRAMLERNLALNKVSNVLVHPVALSDSPGQAEFSISEDRAFSSLRPTGRRRNARKVIVPVRTLDELVPDRPVGILKIDVEGAELAVLRGATRLLADPARAPRAILVELSDRNQRAFGYGPADVVRHLQGLGYQARAITSVGLANGWPSDGMVEDALFLRSV